MVTRSHGNCFKDADSNVIGNFIALQSENIYNSDIEDLAAESLGNLILAIYVGCYTVAGDIFEGTERNLVVATEDRGAATAVGFTDSILCVGANAWVKFFFKNLANGENIESCRYRGVWNYTFTE